MPSKTKSLVFLAPAFKLKLQPTSEEDNDLALIVIIPLQQLPLILL